jgi:hypothetical protein
MTCSIPETVGQELCAFPCSPGDSCPGNSRCSYILLDNAYYCFE